MTRFRVGLSADGVTGSPDSVVVSPDGKRIAYHVRNGTTFQLATRLLDQPKGAILAENALYPFFSPDGNWIGYFVTGKISWTLLFWRRILRGPKWCRALNQPVPSLAACIVQVSGIGFSVSGLGV